MDRGREMVRRSLLIQASLALLSMTLLGALASDWIESLVPLDGQTSGGSADTGSDGDADLVVFSVKPSKWAGNLYAPAEKLALVAPRPPTQQDRSDCSWSSR